MGDAMKVGVFYGRREGRTMRMLQECADNKAIIIAPCAARGKQLRAMANAMGIEINLITMADLISADMLDMQDG